jgi:hypothetical protein
MAHEMRRSTIHSLYTILSITATLGITSAAYDYNSLDCPVSQRPPAQRSAAKSAGDAWPAPTVGRGHQTVRCAPDSVRCANQPEDPTVGCARNGRRFAPDMLQWLSGGAPDCPVRHPTEGNFGLPRMPPTAPSCLGAIKGTPRRMEEAPKHSLIIHKHFSSCVVSSSCGCVCVIVLLF